MKPKEGDDGHGRTSGQAPSLNDSLSNGETRPIPSAKASPSKRGTPFNQEENAADTTDPEVSTSGDVAGSRTVVRSAAPEQGVVVKYVESPNRIQKNQFENEVFI